MKKYKLIRKYPNSPELGTIAVYDKNEWLTVQHNTENDYFVNIRDIKEPQGVVFWKEIIEKPEYVKCITDIRNTKYTLNKIYKVGLYDYVTLENGDDGFGKWNNNKNNGSKFEPSTKEAYDLQELKAKFVFDKWYSITTKPRDTVYKNIRFKVEAVEDTLVTYKYNNYINHNDIYGHGNGMEFKNIIDVKELLVESNEIQQYLPDNHPDKIKPKLDYEILSLNIHDTRISTVTDYGNEYIEALLKDKLNKIHSIKRLSDGEVFTVGDNIIYENKKTKISSFKINYNNIMIANFENQVFGISGSTINVIQKDKPVLFTTHDGVGITENDSYYWFRKANSTPSEPIGMYGKYLANPTRRSTTGNYLFFSSEEACKKHLKLIQENTITRGLSVETDLITVQLTKEKYDLLMQLLEE